MDSDATFVARVEPFRRIHLLLTFFAPILSIRVFSIAKSERMFIVFIVQLFGDGSAFIANRKFAESTL